MLGCNAGAMIATLTLSTPNLTDAVATALAHHLTAPMTLLLSGGVGAGKTHLARRIIQTHLAKHTLTEDIPSPTFTLVQTYVSPELTIWHADLYRLTHIDELTELGLEDALDNDVCLIEWPDLMGPLIPPSALHITFDITGDASRELTLAWTNSKWDSVVEHLKTLSE